MYARSWRTCGLHKNNVRLLRCVGNKNKISNILNNMIHITILSKLMEIVLYTICAEEPKVLCKDWRSHSFSEGSRLLPKWVRSPRRCGRPNVS